MIKELQELGLDYYEARALNILFLEKLSLRELSKKSGIPFGKVYSIIKKLKEKGIVLETNSRPKLVYIEYASEVLSRLIDEKQEKERRLNEKLRETASKLDNLKKRPARFFDIGVTQEENRRIQLRSFSEANEEIIQIINIHHKPEYNRSSKTIWEKEIEKAVGRGVIFKSIYPRKVILPRILYNLNKKFPEKFHVKRFDTDFTRLDIIDRKKVLLKLVQSDPLQFGGVLLIENEKLAENLIRIFNEIWDNAN